MKTDLQSLYRKYRTLRERVGDDRSVESLHGSLRDRREQTVLSLANEVTDFATNLVASISISQAASFDFNSLSPQAREAFELAYPGQGLAWLPGLTEEQLSGVMAGWKGKLFEVIVRDRLNAGEIVGPLALSAGQTAELAVSPTQPGWDLRILDDTGATFDQVQLKATESLQYVKHAIERYPQIQVWATDEAVDGATALGDHIHASGISLDEVHGHLAEPLAELSETPLEQFAHSILPWTPIVVIISTEGIMTLAGRQTFSKALHRSLFRIGRSVAIQFGVVALKVLGFGAGAWVVAPAFHVVIARFQSAQRVQEYIGQWMVVLDTIAARYPVSPHLSVATTGD